VPGREIPVGPSEHTPLGGSCFGNAFTPDLQPRCINHMPESYTRAEPSQLPIERNRCPRCHNHMMLARIEYPNGSNVRTFECLRCDHVQKMLVEYVM
jgi:hypothetical protein